MQSLYSLLTCIFVAFGGAGAGCILRLGVGFGGASRPGNAEFDSESPGSAEDSERMPGNDKSPAAERPFERALVDAALGLGILSLLLFGLMALRLLSLILPVVGVLASFFVWSLAKGAYRPLDAVRVKCPIESILAAGLLAILAVAALIPALAPPSASDWDSLAYHLAVPKLYLLSGGTHYISFTTHSNFPFLMEMLYLPSLRLGDPVGAKLMHYWVGLLLVAAVFALSKRHFNPRGAWFAAIAVAGMPLVLWEATTGYVDISTALYTLLCVYLFLNYLDKPERGNLIRCGIAAGLAASTKMTGLAVVPLIVVWLVADRYAERRRLGWRGAFVFAGVALLVCSPWYIKSVVYTGNPVYPFFYSISAGKTGPWRWLRTLPCFRRSSGWGITSGRFMFSMGSDI